MSRQASKTLIGGFVVGALALVVAGIILLGGGGLFVKKNKYVLFFEGSIKGLNAGAPVQMKGVRVGSVTDVKIKFDPSTLTYIRPVYIELNPNTISQIREGAARRDRGTQAKSTREVLDLLIEKGLRARLQVQSLLTGLLMVELDFFPDKPVKLVGAEPEYPEIPTIPSAMEELGKTLENIPFEELSERLMRTVVGMERLITAPELSASLSSLEATLKELHELVQTLNARAPTLLAHADETVISLKKLLVEVDGRVRSLAETLQVTLEDFDQVAKNVDQTLPPLAMKAGDALVAAERALVEATQTLENIRDMTGGNSTLNIEVNRALREATAAARSIRVMADYLRQNPNAFIYGKRGGR